MRGRKSTEEFRVSGVVERLTPYEGAQVDPPEGEVADPELVERAATLLAVMPRNQLRSTVERLLSPNDLEKGRQRDRRAHRRRLRDRGRDGPHTPCGLVAALQLGADSGSLPHALQVGVARRDVVPRRREPEVAQDLERREEYWKRRAARGDLLEVALVERVRRLLDESRDELVVVLGGRRGRAASQTRRNAAAFRRNHVGVRPLSPSASRNWSRKLRRRRQSRRLSWSSGRMNSIFSTSSCE